MRPAVRAAARLAAVAVLALLAACASRPPAPADADRPARDGPPLRVPPGLQQVPDAVPRIEPQRVGGPNKPYEQFGRRYVPLTGDVEYAESGGASWYGRKFHGLPTSSGEPYDMFAMTAAHRTLPIPSYVWVRNPANGREVVVRVNDRGPFAEGRVIDLSYTAALKLGLLGGVAPVQLRRITHDEIRAGWRGAAAAEAPRPVAAGAGAMAPPADDAVAGELAGPATAAVHAGDGPPAAGWWLQLGAFRQRDGALLLRQRVMAEAGMGVAVADDGRLLRVYAGPYADRAAADAAAQALAQRLGLQPLPLLRR